MNHPIISSANGKARYNEMVQTADNYRRVKQLQDSQLRPSTLARFFGSLTARFSNVESDQVTEPVTRPS